MLQTKQVTSSAAESSQPIGASSHHPIGALSSGPISTVLTTHTSTVSSSVSPSTLSSDINLSSYKSEAPSTDGDPYTVAQTDNDIIAKISPQSTYPDISTPTPPSDAHSTVTIEYITTSPVITQRGPNPNHTRNLFVDSLANQQMAATTESAVASQAPPISPPPLVKFLRTAPPLIDSEVEDVDARPSAIVIGVSAVFLAVGFITLVCILDASSLYRDLKKLRRNLTRITRKENSKIRKYKAR